jgi:hypothetical protein
MKPVLMDASSAILLFKARRLGDILARYRVLLPASVLAELTVSGRPGERRFGGLVRTGCAQVLAPPDEESAPPVVLRRLGAGERDCIRAFLDGHGDFILMDDGKGAGYCRRVGIPYVNALLVPRLLEPGSPSPRRVLADMQRIYRLGRYAPWVLSHATRLTPRDLHRFLP